MSEFKFDTWCAKYELKDSTRKWLVSNGCDSLSALRGMNADEIPIGAEGVENLGERSKLRGGVQDLKAPVQGVSIPQTFRELLRASGLINVDERTMELVQNQPRVLFCTSSEEARQLYDDMDKLPRTTTRATLDKELDVQIGPHFVAARSIMFYVLFQGRLMALKIPRKLKELFTEAKTTQEREEAMIESKLMTESQIIVHEVDVWKSLNNPPKDVHLVPLRLLDIKGKIETFDKFDSNEKPGVEVLVRKGSLMPLYVCPASRFAEIATPREILAWCKSVFHALQYMHRQGWSHNDVKAANIFLDDQGVAWLGDYGACRRHGEDAQEHTYWEPGAPQKASPRVDYYCLLLTALVLLGAWNGSCEPQLEQIPEMLNGEISLSPAGKQQLVELKEFLMSVHATCSQTG